MLPQRGSHACSSCYHLPQVLGIAVLEFFDFSLLYHTGLCDLTHSQHGSLHPSLSDVTSWDVLSTLAVHENTMLPELLPMSVSSVAL